MKVLHIATASLLLLACAGDDSAGSSSTAGITSASAGASATSTSTAGSDGSSSGDAATETSGSSGGSTSTASTSTASTSTTSSTSGGDATGMTGGATDSTTGDTTGDPSEFVMLHDPLIDGTMGTAVGGSFGADGWTVTGKADRIYWALPRLAEGSVEFTMTGVTLDNMPLNDHEVFAMYEGGYGIEHPIDYAPEYRTNAYKAMIRIYGTAEAQRIGEQKLMWGMCPMGAPGHYDAECPCADPVGFHAEPFGGDGAWDGSPQVLRVERGDGVSRYRRNGAVVLEIDWSESGMTYGPDQLYVSLGTPRAEKVASAGMPIGAVFSDVKIEGWTGPASELCL